MLFLRSGDAVGSNPSAEPEDLPCFCSLSFWHSELRTVVCVCVCVCVKEGERDYANMFLFSENSAHVNEDCRKQPNLVGMLFL